MNRKYFIKTYGCQMNVGDSEKLADVLETAGYQPTGDPRLADIVLVNTCVVRQKAEDKASWYIATAKGLKKYNPHVKIGVCGCLVTVPGRDVKKTFPHVDFFIPPNQPEKLAEFINSPPLSPSLNKRGGNRAQRGGGEFITRYITIMHGCDNFCSYCIVPYVRGREHSRPVKEILNEIQKVDFDQYKELFLLGQNVNSYKYGLAKLLHQIEDKISPLHGMERGAGVRIRFMTSHPKDMSDEIINAVAELPHVCEYFHVAIQHGDDEILKSMNRGYTADYYRKMVDRIRAKLPDAAITSDVIVGYPGETDQQFRNTLSIIEEIGFDACNTLVYSVRPATAAAKLKDDVPEKIKKERLQQIMEVVDAVVLKNNKKLVGSVQELLVDKCFPSLRSGEGCRGEVYSGRTRTNKIVKIASDRKNLLGRLVNVRITSARSWILEGELING